MTKVSRNMARRRSVGEMAAFIAGRIKAGLTYGVPDWELGACRNGKSAATNFFPEGDDAAKAEAEAKRVCGGCPIWSLCLAYEMQRQLRSPAKRTTFGIWGGSDPRQRNFALKQAGLIK